MTAPPLSKAADLPPLPEPTELTPQHNRNFVGFVHAYTAEQMRAYVESDRALRQEPEQFALDGTADIQMIQNVADPEGALQAHWPDEYLAWYKPEQWMGPSVLDASGLLPGSLPAGWHRFASSQLSERIMQLRQKTARNVWRSIAFASRIGDYRAVFAVHADEGDADQASPPLGIGQ